MFNLSLDLPIVGDVKPAYSGLSFASAGERPNAFNNLKAKMKAGQNAVIFINGDSTSYSEYGPYYKFAVMLGDKHDYTVIMHRWAEWVTSAPTGPKEYSAAVTLRTGTRGTLHVYLAAIPGQVAGAMFDGTRRANAIDGIPTPDICIMHHGHNQQSFQMNAGIGGYAVGAGTLLGPMGMTEEKWPNVPQLITSQNPWRDDNGYAKVYEAIKLAVLVHKGLTFIDTYARFIAMNKLAALYRDNIHPSDTVTNSAGAQLIADAFMSVYKTASSSIFVTPAWPLIPAPNLIDNGDFSNWTGAAPATWSIAGSGTAIAKDTAIKYGSAAYSAAVSPSTTIQGQNSYLQKYLSATEMARIAGKTVTFAVLMRGKSTQINPQCYFSIKDKTGVIRDYTPGAVIGCKDGWMWFVAPGIPVTADAADTWRYLRVTPSHSTAIPTVADALNVQRVLITEGSSPKGLIA